MWAPHLTWSMVVPVPQLFPRLPSSMTALQHGRLPCDAAADPASTRKAKKKKSKTLKIIFGPWWDKGMDLEDVTY